MSKLIKLKIDLTKVDKNRLFTGKTGAKYLDATFFLSDEPDQYGNHGMITQDVTKEERESGERGAILGNAKCMGDFADKGGTKPKQVATVEVDDIDGLPF